MKAVNTKHDTRTKIQLDFFEFLEENNMKFKIHIGEDVSLSFYHKDIGYSSVCHYKRDISEKGLDDYFNKALSQAIKFLKDMQYLK